jgi:Plasmid pRiA4b ORF-3-like protein
VLQVHYDFGDDWTHTVQVEKELPVDSRVAYPVCIAGARACPPEDCGSIPGYIGICAALKGAKGDDHDDLVRWLGGYFDPEGFDVNRTNRAIREIR